MKKLVFVLMIVLALCIGAAAAENTEILGESFPDITVKDTDGNEFSLSGVLKDHEAVLINIWATWCPPCRNEFPDLNEAYLKYKDRVAFIALSSDPGDTIPVINDFRKELGLSIPMGSEEGTGLTSYLGVAGIPTTVVVDRFGNAVFMKTGAFSGTAEVSRLLEAFLGEQYTQTTVLNEIPRDSATRAFPVSPARTLHVENENARKIAFRENSSGQNITGYIVNEDTVHLRFEIAAGDNPVDMIYYDETSGAMHELSGLLDAERKVYVYEQVIPGEDAEYRITSGTLANSSDPMDADMIYVMLFASEEQVEKLADYYRTEGLDISWEYDDNNPAERKAKEAYVLYTVDQNGQPVPGVTVNFCTDTACNTQVSDENGLITVSGAPENYHVQLLKVPEGYSYDQGFEMYTGIAFGEWKLIIRKD